MQVVDTNQYSSEDLPHQAPQLLHDSHISLTVLNKCFQPSNGFLSLTLGPAMHEVISWFDTNGKLPLAVFISGGACCLASDFRIATVQLNAITKDDAFGQRDMDECELQ